VCRENVLNNFFITYFVNYFYFPLVLRLAVLGSTRVPFSTSLCDRSIQESVECKPTQVRFLKFLFSGRCGGIEILARVKIRTKTLLYEIETINAKFFGKDWLTISMSVTATTNSTVATNIKPFLKFSEIGVEVFILPPVAYYNLIAC
jgi:hypothetical protein